MPTATQSVEFTQEIAAARRSSALFRERMISDCAAALVRVNIQITTDSAWSWLCRERGMDGKTAKEMADDVAALAVRIRRGDISC